MKKRKKTVPASLVPQKQYPLQLLVMLLIVVALLFTLVITQLQYPTGRAVQAHAADVISGERWQSCTSLLPHIQNHYARYDRQFAAGILSKDFLRNRDDQLFALDFAATLVNREPFFGRPCNQALVSVDSSGKVLRLTFDERLRFYNDACRPGQFGYFKRLIDGYVQCAQDPSVCYDISLDPGLAIALRESGYGLLAQLNSFDIEGYCKGVQ